MIGPHSTNRSCLAMLIGPSRRAFFVFSQHLTTHSWIARPAFVLCGGWCGALFGSRYRLTLSSVRCCQALSIHFARPMILIGVRGGATGLSRPLAELGLLQNLVISLIPSHDSRTLPLSTLIARLKQKARRGGSHGFVHVISHEHPTRE
jgi:hypothetical protein